MLEIPEAITIARECRETLIGKVISNVVVGATPHKFAFFNHPEQYPDLLIGKTINGANSYGGFVQINASDKSITLSDTCITLSDGVNLRYYDSSNEVPSKHQLLITFHDSSFLVASIQMYGFIMVFKVNDTDNPYYLISKQLPSPLSEEFSYTYFNHLILPFLDKTMSVKEFLATKQRIPGLGNGVLQDILFNAFLNPKRKINTLNSDDINRLFHSIKSTLTMMVDHQGRDTEKDLFGNMGCYKTILSSKTKDTLCPRCHSLIRKEAYLGGSVYYCMNCQK